MLLPSLSLHRAAVVFRHWGQQVTFNAEPPRVTAAPATTEDHRNQALLPPTRGGTTAATSGNQRRPAIRPCSARDLARSSGRWGLSIRASLVSAASPANPAFA